MSPAPFHDARRKEAAVARRHLHAGTVRHAHALLPNLRFIFILFVSALPPKSEDSRALRVNGQVAPAVGRGG